LYKLTIDMLNINQCCDRLIYVTNLKNTLLAHQDIYSITII